MLLCQIKHVLEVLGLEEPAKFVEVAIVETLIEGENPFRIHEVFKRP